jgi:quercetin dioxygenase-like cupin family protein
MPNQTVTRFIESDKSPAALLRVLQEPSNVPQWAPVFADTIERVDGMRYRVTKGEDTFFVEVSVHEPAGCVDYLREMPDGNRGGAYIRVTPRPKGGSTITMTVPVSPTTTEQEVAKVVTAELDALVRLSGHELGKTFQAESQTRMTMSGDRFPQLQRWPLLKAALPEANPPVNLVKGARIRFAPGQPTGLHLHPTSTVGVVTEGTFHFQLQGEPAQVLRPGDCFFEPAGRTVIHFDNASTHNAAEIVCFYLTDSEDRAPIAMLNGGMEAQLGRKA